MNKVFKKASSLIWFIVTVSTTVVLVVANILLSGSLNSLICGVLGGKRAITQANENTEKFVQDFDNKEDAFNNAAKVTETIADEGMVLLKNDNNALPLKKDANGKIKVSVFGKNSVNLVTGGSGSAAPTNLDHPNKTIFDSLEAAGIEYNKKLKDFYNDNNKSGNKRDSGPTMGDMDKGGSVGTIKTGETALSKYTSVVKNSYAEYSDAALVVFSRIAGENWDLPRVAADNQNRHYLELDNNERDLLVHICEQNFKHVIVLFNTSNNIDPAFLEFEDDPAYNNKIDGAILIGSVGGYGIMALGRILTGEVNPSGHTVDIMYTKYEEDPTWQNFGDNTSCLGAGTDEFNIGGVGTGYYFVDYEEGIYYGYRYYETRGQIDGESWYNNHVVYPFGYGLSYTTFTQTIVNKAELEAAKLDNTLADFKVQVKVKNTGTVAGKEVVQLYVQSPYTNGGIEKAYKQLCAFGKTSLLAPGAEETVELTVNPYYFASFDYNDKNGNNFKGYELEAGNYVFHLAKNSHEDIETFTKALDAGFNIENDPVTSNEVKVLFEDADDHLSENLSRSDFTGTFPKSPTDIQHVISAEDLDTLKKIGKAASHNPNLENDFEDYDFPDKYGLGTNYGLTLKDLVGRDYDDWYWECFLDQMDPQEMLDFINHCLYSTPENESLGIPRTLSCDGPTGIVNFLGTGEVYGTNYYCSECLVAQTYNVELAKAEGLALGNECLLGDARANGSHISYTGWYAPGVNIHRSPFSGRNTEYYSEDPFLAGKMAASLIQGAQEKGVYTNVKHFALNDQETHRSINGDITWCNEQAMREIYLRPFEMAIKEGKTLGLMTSFNRIGLTWAGGDYRLCTTVLREEWGFQGSVICDFHTSVYMDSEQMHYAGGDVNLSGTAFWDCKDFDDLGNYITLRNATHNALYALANSNAMRYDIVGYSLPIWQELLYVADAVIAVGFAVWGYFAITSATGTRRFWEKKKQD